MVYTSKKQLIDQMKENLRTNKNVRTRAVVRIFQNQTKDEQISESTNRYNGIGFTGADAPLLTSFAKQFIWKGWLSEKQDYLLTKRIVKYAGQLVNGSIAEGKIVEYKGRYYTNESVAKLRKRMVMENA